MKLSDVVSLKEAGFSVEQILQIAPTMEDEPANAPTVQNNENVVGDVLQNITEGFKSLREELQQGFIRTSQQPATESLDDFLTAAIIGPKEVK